MTQPKNLVNSTRLVQDPDKIAKLYGVDQAQAKIIYEMLKAVEDAIRELVKVQSKIVKEQGEFIDTQASTAKTIERELGREKDAKKIIEYIKASLTGEPVKKQHILSEIFIAIVAAQMVKLTEADIDTLLGAVAVALGKVKKD